MTESWYERMETEGVGERVVVVTPATTKQKKDDIYDILYESDGPYVVNAVNGEVMTDKTGRKLRMGTNDMIDGTIVSVKLLDRVPLKQYFFQSPTTFTRVTGDTLSDAYLRRRFPKTPPARAPPRN
jgi:hypothetical protein